ncbi:hypothetical protein TNCV_170221 [Trichonephila clavipes]|nr:hypothetical protein TNCV_170221 [Trichonephila clavipes]
MGYRSLKKEREKKNYSNLIKACNYGHFSELTSDKTRPRPFLPDCQSSLKAAISLHIGERVAVRKKKQLTSKKNYVCKDTRCGIARPVVFDKHQQK